MCPTPRSSINHFNVYSFSASFSASTLISASPSSRPDVHHLSRGRDLDEQLWTVLDDLVGEVLPDVDVLGTFPSADDVVTALDARGVVLVYRGRAG